MRTNSKAVEEVWKWRDKIAETIKDMTPSEQVKHFTERGRILVKEFGLKHSEPKPVHSH